MCPEAELRAAQQSGYTEILMVSAFPLLLAVTILVVAPKRDVDEPIEPTGAGEVVVSQVETAIVDSCRVALGTDGCQLARASPTSSEQTIEAGEAPYFVVTIERDDVSVELRTPPTSTLRTLHFSAEDSQSQRWVAAGLLVAAMSAALQPKPQPEAAPAAAPALIVAQQQGARQDDEVSSESIKSESVKKGLAEKKQKALLALDAAGQIVIGLPLVTLAGGTMRLNVLTAKEHGLFMGLKYLAALQAEPQIWHGSMSFGGTFALCSKQRVVSCGVSAELLGDLLHVSQVPQSTQSRSTFRAGAAFSFGISPHWGTVSPWASLHGVGYLPSVEIQRDSEVIQKVPAIEAGLSLGVRFSFGMKRSKNQN